MTIRAVFFDMGGTIETCYHDRELRVRATPELKLELQEAGIDPGLGTEELYQVVADGLTRYKRWCMQSLTELPADIVWRDYILAGYPIDAQRLAAAAEALTYFVDTRYFRREMRPEMPQVVDALQRMGLKMGVISNILSHGQVPRNLEAYGLEPYFDPVVLSSAYGRRKPDPAIFHHAASRMGVPTSSCVYIGDRISRDVLGARRAGYGMVFQIVHDFDHGENDDGPAPDLVLHNMLDLIPVLEGELSKPNNGLGIQDSGGVKAILFDAGDLLYFRPQEGRRLQCFLESLGISMPQDFQAKAEALKSRAFCGEISQETYFETLVRFCGVQDLHHIDEGKRILGEEGDDVRFFDGVRETLTRLKQRGFLLAIVTDTAQPVWAKLGWFEAEGIGHLWDAFVSSREVGFRKPDPRIYHAALRQLGAQPCEAVFIGHKATELDGAKAVGLATVAFNRDDDAEGDISIEHFSELSELPLLRASPR